MRFKIFEKETFKQYTEEEVESRCKYKTYEDFVVRKFIEKHSLQVDIRTSPIKDYVKFKLEDHYDENAWSRNSFKDWDFSGFEFENERLDDKIKKTGDEILDNNISDKNDIFYFESSEKNHKDIKEIFKTIQIEKFSSGIYIETCEDSKKIRRPRGKKSNNKITTGEYYIYLYTYNLNIYNSIRIIYIPGMSLEVELIPHCTCKSCRGNYMIILNKESTIKLEKYVLENELEIIEEHRQEILSDLYQRDENRADSMIDYCYSEEVDPEEEGLNDLYEYYYK